MLSIRLAEERDFDFFLKLKSEEFNIFWTGGDDKPEEESLKKFFCDALAKQYHNDARKIYIIENENNEKVGHLYIIPNGNDFDLPCAVLSEYGGRGYAKEAIRLGLEEGKKLGFKRMVGSIREDNIASMKAYTACGVSVLEDYKDVYIPKLNSTVKMFTVVKDM